MIDLKVFTVACAAFFFVWKVFNKKVRQNSLQLESFHFESEENPKSLFKKSAHDILLTVITNDSAASITLRTSYSQKLVLTPSLKYPLINIQVTIGRMHFNVLPLVNPLISSEHAIIKWSTNENCWLLVSISHGL